MRVQMRFDLRRPICIRDGTYEGRGGRYQSVIVDAAKRIQSKRQRWWRMR